MASERPSSTKTSVFLTCIKWRSFPDSWLLMAGAVAMGARHASPPRRALALTACRYDARRGATTRRRPRWRLPEERQWRSEEHTSELQSLMRISYAVLCLKKKTNTQNTNTKDNENMHKHNNEVLSNNKKKIQ